MARNGSTTIQPGETGTDDDTLDDLEQAEVGSLFNIRGPEYETVKWSIFRFKTRAELAQDPGGEKKEWVAEIVGELDGPSLLDVVGGGTFQFQGYVPQGVGGRGVKMLHNRRVALAGPRKNFAAVAAAAPIAVANAPAAAADSNIERLMKIMLRERRDSEARFEKILAALSQRPSESNSLTEMVTALEAMKRMSSTGGPNTENPVALAKMMLDSFHSGVTIGQEREPIPVRGEGDPPDYMPIIAKGLEIVERMMSRTRRPQPPPSGAPGAAPPPPPPPRSEAHVVEDPPTSEKGTTPEHRFTTAVEALYRAMVNGRDPADFADSLADMLNPEEVAMISGGGVDQVLHFLAPVIEGFPQLKTEQGRVYLGAVLTALRDNGTEDGAS